MYCLSWQPVSSLSFAPLRIGFPNCTLDAFNVGQTAAASIISIAEVSNRSDWFAAFAAAGPSGVRTGEPNPRC